MKFRGAKLRECKTRGMDRFEELWQSNKDLVLSEIKEALDRADKGAVKRLAEDICKAERVFLTGTGRVFLSMQAFCKRLTHLGIDAHCVGDITEPALSAGNLLIAASGSGESVVPVAIAKRAKELGAKIVHIGSNAEGHIKQYSDYMVRIPVRTRLNREDEMGSKQIMTSLFEQSVYLLGDILSLIIMEGKGLKLDKLWQYHANIE